MTTPVQNRLIKPRCGNYNDGIECGDDYQCKECANENFEMSDEDIKKFKQHPEHYPKAPERLPEFSSADILRFIQWLAPKAGIHTLKERPSNHQAGRAIAKQGRKEVEIVIIAHQRWPHILGIRSLLTIKSLNKPHSWLVNGQPGRNTHALRFDGEQGPCLIPSKQQMRAFFESKYGNPDGETSQSHWNKWMKGAGSRSAETHLVIAENLGYSNEITFTLPD
jgi:hypothetical protein